MNKKKRNAVQEIYAAFNTKNSERFALNVDWLELHVQSKYDFKEFDTSRLHVKLTGRTKVFQSVYTITSKRTKEIIATYATDANGALFGGEKGHGVLKIENKQLYLHHSSLKGFTEKLLRHLRLDFIGITRFDLAYDFNSFQNMRNPESFIRALHQNRIMKLGNTRLTTYAQITQEAIDYNQVSFGSKSSNVCYKLYNKTHEQSKEIRKDYIWQDWETSKLDMEKPVWRLEFSLQGHKANIKNDYTDIDFHSLEILNLHNITGLFRALYEKYFRFVHKEAGQTRKDRMKEVYLLDFPTVFFQTRYKRINPVVKNSDRSVRILINQLEKHRNELRGVDPDFDIDAKVQISKLIDLYGLHDWAKRKYIDYDRLNYAKDIEDVIYTPLNRPPMTEQQITEIQAIGQKKINNKIQ